MYSISLSKKILKLESQWKVRYLKSLSKSAYFFSRNLGIKKSIKSYYLFQRFIRYKKTDKNSYPFIGTLGIKKVFKINVTFLADHHKDIEISLK